MAEMLNTKDYEHYRGNEILSAQIAFYALGDKMLDVGFINDIDSADDKRKVTTLTNGRKKFLEKYTKDDLLSKSLFYEFASLIENTLLKNAEEKIKKSYYNKVHYILSGMIEMLEKLCEIYNDLYSKCKKEVDLSCDNIDRILQGTKQNFKSECDSVIDKFKSKVRNQMYNDINKDISNGDFKDKFEKTIEKEQEILKANFQEASNNVQEKFKKDLSDELENLQRRIGNVAEEFKEITLSNKFDSSLNIKIDNGINTMGLLSTGIGGAGLAMWIAGATNIWNPAGIAIIALSVLGLIISFGKAIRGFFDKEYKKREQRKSVDENLQKISQDMKKEVKKSIDEQARDNLEPYIKSVKDKLEKSVESIKNLSEFLEDSQNEVQNLANTIKIEGGL